jgi:hypothetical protein
MRALKAALMVVAVIGVPLVFAGTLAGLAANGVVWPIYTFIAGVGLGVLLGLFRVCWEFMGE